MIGVDELNCGSLTRVLSYFAAFCINDIQIYEAQNENMLEGIEYKGKSRRESPPGESAGLENLGLITSPSKTRRLFF